MAAPDDAARLQRRARHLHQQAAAHKRKAARHRRLARRALRALATVQQQAARHGVRLEITQTHEESQ